MPRLTPTQEAALPALYQQHNGNISAVAVELGVSRAAIHKRLSKIPSLRIPAKAVVPTPEKLTDATTLSDQERQIARGLLVQAGKVAHENPTVRDLVAAAQGLIDLANSRDKAHQMMLTYIDQRQVHITAEAVPEKVIEELAARWAMEILPALCPACQEKFAVEGD